MIYIFRFEFYFQSTQQIEKLNNRHLLQTNELENLLKDLRIQNEKDMRSRDLQIHNEQNYATDNDLADIEKVKNNETHLVNNELIVS